MRVMTASVPTALAVLGLTGCAALGGGDNDAYLKSKSLPSLQAPPSIVLPERDQTYRLPQPGPAVSRSAVATRPAAAPAPVARAPEVAAAPQPSRVTLHTEGELRWLNVPESPERVWALLKAFWADQGIKLAEDRPDAGVMRTEWINENPKISQAELQRLVAEGGNGKDVLLRHQYRVRVERTAQGSNVYLTYLGARLVKGADGKPRWEMEAVKPELETAMLNRLQQRLSRL